MSTKGVIGNSSPVLMYNVELEYNHLVRLILARENGGFIYLSWKGTIDALFFAFSYSKTYAPVGTLSSQVARLMQPWNAQ